MTDRFDLEQRIMDCWHIIEDIKEVNEAICEGNVSTDEAVNILLGIEQLYNLRFDKLFRTFETLIRKDAFAERESFDDNPYCDEIPF